MSRLTLKQMRDHPVNDKRHSRFDEAKEDVDITGMRGKIGVEARHRCRAGVKLT